MSYRLVDTDIFRQQPLVQVFQRSMLSTINETCPTPVVLGRGPIVWSSPRASPGANSWCSLLGSALRKQLPRSGSSSVTVSPMTGCRSPSS